MDFFESKCQSKLQFHVLGGSRYNIWDRSHGSDVMNRNKSDFIYLNNGRCLICIGNNHNLFMFNHHLFLICCSNHVLTEDIISREVSPTNCLISRRLLTKTSRSPRWMERYLPKHMASSAYIIEDSIVDPQKRTMTTLTWNISHARLMVGQRFPTCSLSHTLLHPVQT